VDLRAATIDDLPDIVAIYNDAVLRTTATADYHPQSLAQRRDWFDAHQRDGLPMWVAVEAGQLVAWASLNRYHVRPGYRFTVDNSIYVAAHARGRGAGRALLERLVQDARGLGMRSVVAVIDGSNAVSIALHERLGFQEVGRIQDAMFKFDRWLDVVYLQLSLK
jgi:L-amino acid N-acyltransferase